MLRKTKLAAVLGLAAGTAVFALAITATQPAQTASAAAKPAASTTKKPSTDKTVYHYVAQPGDSYTQMARKAVQTYGKVHHVNLQNAQIIYIETNMTQADGSPLLNLGQAVDIPAQTVAGWITKAQNLTPEQIAAWQYYVQFVDFNTDHVGQP